MGRIVSAEEIARPFRDEVRETARTLGAAIMLRGILASERRASEVYAQYTANGCADVGMSFELVKVPKLAVEEELARANDDAKVHGVIVYYPIFGPERDRTLQDEVKLEKDVEGLNSAWAYRLYHDQRFLDAGATRKAVLPCTALAVVKTLETLAVYRAGAPVGEQLRGKTACVFNRSEVVGRPLAAMLAHDGARVLSFDLDGLVVFEGKEAREAALTRAEALSQSDVVVTGVPSPDFVPVRAREIKPDSVCINISTYKNVDDDVVERASAFLPRVGPITVAMLLRNTLRLYENFHVGGKP
ncbi:bifunctional methylenetetrahydrofolate dehydrogenase/methenyltetrahydrofolate cyclohydrolase [bacterium]|nr:bifunctional methylenetetrahydrofolate dehydrogenase/methenyltetrahydrofolate cyclohydrolase [bacterium]